LSCCSLPFIIVKSMLN